jgi:hypothetical protein
MPLKRDRTDIGIWSYRKKVKREKRKNSVARLDPAIHVLSTAPTLKKT